MPFSIILLLYICFCVLLYFPVVCYEFCIILFIYLTKHSYLNISIYLSYVCSHCVRLLSYFEALFPNFTPFLLPEVFQGRLGHFRVLLLFLPAMFHTAFFCYLPSLLLFTFYPSPFVNLCGMLLMK